MIGLANMAHRLAVHRTGYNGMSGSGSAPCCMSRESSDLYRDVVYPHVQRTTTAEYLRIIDRLTRGEKP